MIDTSGAMGMALGRRAALGGTAALVVAGAGPADTPRRGGILKVAYRAGPSSLDPITGRVGDDHGYLYPICETLVDFEPKTMTPIPGLARAWSFPDPKTMVLDLVENAMFHDGTPFDADAVKFNLERAASDPRSNVRTDFDSVSEIRVTGKYQITLALKQPDSSLLLTFSDRSGMMVSPTTIRKLGTGNADRQPVGTGPMKFVSISDGDKVVYARNENFRVPGQPYLDGIVVKIIPDTATCLRSVIAGENDLTHSLLGRQKPLLDRAKNLTVTWGPTFIVHQVYLNYARPPFSDVRVRQALSYSIDRVAMNKAIALGMDEPTCSLMPSQHWAYDKVAAERYSLDIAKARALLAEAGHADGLDIHFWCDPAPQYQQVAEVMMEQVRQAGFRLKISLANAGDSATHFFGPTKEGDGRMAQWSGRPDPTQTFRQLFGKGSYYNAGGQATPDVEEGIAATMASYDIETRKAALSKLQRLVADQSLMLLEMFDATAAASNSKVRGYQPNLLGKPKLTTIWLAA